MSNNLYHKKCNVIIMSKNIRILINNAVMYIFDNHRKYKLSLNAEIHKNFISFVPRWACANNTKTDQ